MNAFDKLLDHFGGSQTNIARHYNVSRETVRLWGIRGLPSDRALDFERDTFGKVTIREVLESKRASA